MPISDIWTLEPNGTPASAATLSALGFSSGTLTRASQTPGTLTLAMPRGDAATMSLGDYTWASAWVLRRDGEVFYRGYVSTPPRRSAGPGGEALSVVLSDILWKLDRTPYTQEWTHAGGASLAAVRTARARLCWDQATGTRSTTKAALAQIAAAASAAGVSVTLAVSALPDLTPPPIEGTHRTCGELIREIMRWHPDCELHVVSTADGDTLTAVQRDTATVVSINLGSAPLTDLDLVQREDLAVDAVRVSYEAEIGRSASVPGETETDPAIIRTRDRLAVFTDIYPVGATITWRSLDVVIPVPGGSGNGAANPPAPALPHKVAIKTRPLPQTGDYDADAEKFYLKHLGLEGLGLTVDNIALPTSTVGDVQVHTLAFAHPADDPNDPLFEPPSAINPASTPLWRPAAVTDLPRYLVNGTLAEWMNVKAADVRCTATVGVSKTAVDALTPRNRARFMELRPRPGTVSGVDAWMIEADVVVRGTDAKTRRYVNWTKGGTSNVTTDNAAASTAAESAVVIDGLAQALYTARSSAPWEGSVNLTAEEAGEATYLGKVIRLVHADRSDWTTMRALVQSETLDLAGGGTRLQFGLPKHLEPQDYLALATAPKEAARGGGGVRPAPIVPTSAEEAGTDEEDTKEGGVYPGSVPPLVQAAARGIGGNELWGLQVVDEVAGTFKLINPGTVKKTTAYDASGLVTVANIGDTFTAAAGSAMILKVAPDASITAEVVATSWTGWPYPIESEETTPSGNWVMKYFRHMLYDFVSSTTDPTAVKIKAGVFAEFRGFRDHLQLVPTDMEDSAGRIIPTLELLPATGCRRS